MTDHTPSSSEEPLGALVHRLTEQVPQLIRSELRLAQAELTEKGKRAGLGLGAFGAAGLIALYGLGALIAGLILLLALVLPAWASALIVAGVLFVIAAVAAVVGRREVKQATPAAPERAVAGVKQDVATLKGGHS
ncbi:phage holin family protein [Nocardioides sp. zg-DK7169]|nr:phage holin family protein [Nocardioides sp. zg-DK7169]NPC95730.1 phage holin family protein [Nocardioides sp. zg-DK7169]